MGRDIVIGQPFEGERHEDAEEDAEHEPPPLDRVTGHHRDLHRRGSREGLGRIGLSRLVELLESLDRFGVELHVARALKLRVGRLAENAEGDLAFAVDEEGGRDRLDDVHLCARGLRLGDEVVCLLLVDRPEADVDGPFDGRRRWLSRFRRRRGLTRGDLQVVDHDLAVLVPVDKGGVACGRRSRRVRRIWRGGVRGEAFHLIRRALEVHLAEAGEVLDRRQLIHAEGQHALDAILALVAGEVHGLRARVVHHVVGADLVLGDLLFLGDIALDLLDGLDFLALEQGDIAELGGRDGVLGATHHEVGERDGSDRGDRCRAVEALADRHEGILVDVVASPHTEDADDGGQDADTSGHEREEDQPHPSGLVEDRSGGGAENDGGHESDFVGLEDVGGHSRAVADVIADVVGDRRRVARIVFGDPGLDLADEVGSDVGGLGVDTASDAHEERGERSAEAEADQKLHGVLTAQEENERGPDEAHADCHEAGDGAALERHFQRLLVAGQRGGRRAHVGLDRHHHAAIARDVGGQHAAEETDAHVDADHVAERGAVHCPQARAEDQHERQHHAELLPEVGEGAVLDRGADLLHLLVAGRGGRDLPREYPRENHRDHAETERGE